MKLFTAPSMVGYDTNLYSYGQGAYDFTCNADRLMLISYTLRKVSVVR